MRRGSPRYDAIVQLATHLGVRKPSTEEAAGWSTPAMEAPDFSAAVEARLLARARRPDETRRSRSSRYGCPHVYFIEGAGRVKIGIAGRVALRLEQLQAASPVPLVLLLAVPGDLTVEKALHRRFAALRTHGEWFSAEAPLLAFIRELKRLREPAPPRVQGWATGWEKRTL